MNRLILDYTIPKYKVINITPYWLLGFIEEEACFSINKHNNYRLDFNLYQSSINNGLMKSIKVYLDNFPDTEGYYANALGISKVSRRSLLTTLTMNLLQELKLYVFHLSLLFLYLFYKVLLYKVSAERRLSILKNSFKIKRIRLPFIRKRR